MHVRIFDRFRLLGFIVLSNLIGVLSAPGQTNSFIHYGIEEGLPSSEVYDIFQDKTGFIWFATDNGVIRFDGQEMELYQVQHGLPDPVIFGFYEDAKGRIWFRSFSGRLSSFKDNVISRYAFNDSLAAVCGQAFMHTLFVDSIGQVWFGAGSRMGRVTAEGKLETERLPPFQAAYRSVGKNFIASYQGASRSLRTLSIDHHVFPIELSDRKVNNNVIKVQPWRGSLYISVSNQIFRYDKGSLTPAFRGPDHIFNLSVDQEDNLWVGFKNSGASRFAKTDLSDPFPVLFLSGKSVTKIIQDHQRGYWFSTLQDGVFHVPDLSILHYTISPDSKIKTAIAQDGKTFIGDQSGRLTTIDSRTTKIVRSTPIPGSPLFMIFRDSRKQFWTSTSNGSFKLDSTQAFTRQVSYENDFCEDTDGSIVSVGNTRIDRYAPDGRLLNSRITNETHRSIHKCGNFYLITGRTGFGVYDKNLNPISRPAGFQDLKISKILDLNDSLLLISTIGNGFFVTNKNKWTYLQYTAGKNFTTSNIYASLISDSLVWLGTENGIATTTIASLVAKHPNFSFLTKKSGLISNKIDLLVYSKPDIWVFSDNAFCILSGRAKNTAPAKTIFYLKTVKVNNVNTPPASIKSLSYLQNNIQITFGFIDFASDHIFTRSRLTAGSPWTYSKERSRSYNLIPGNYRFELEYSIDSIHWTPVDTHLSFAIAYPWWERWYVELAFILGLLLVVYGFFTVRMSSLHQRNLHLSALNQFNQTMIKAEIDTLEKERSRIAKDLHDGVGMNLTVIKLNVGQLLQKYIPPQDFAIENKLDDTIREIRNIIFNLTPAAIALTGLAEAVREFILKTTHDLAVKIELLASGDKVTDAKISLFTFRIIQELLANSLKHSSASVITIRITSAVDNLTIIFQDNGTGFDPETSKHGSGLLNIQARIESLKGNMQFSSKGTGVFYIFNIPLPDATTGNSK